MAEKPRSIVFNPSRLELSDLKNTEWLLANGLGGYASSTIISLNTRKYHGLLIAASENMKRTLLLQNLEEKLVLKSGETFNLSNSEYSNRTIAPRGLEFLDKFEYLPDSGVRFHYNAGGIEATKNVRMLRGRNAVIVSYDLHNGRDSEVEFRVNPLVNVRSIHELTAEGDMSIRSRILNGNVVEVRSPEGGVLLYSNVSGFAQPEYRWHRNLLYSQEFERGYESVEDAYVPASFTINAKPFSRESFFILASGFFGEEKVEDVLRGLYPNNAGGVVENERKLPGDSNADVMILSCAADSFVVSAGGGKTVIAGYHWFGSWGRDSLISLPGLTLVNGRFDDAREILELFLSKCCNGRIPTELCCSGEPSYDYDSSLWLIDRVYQYIKYVGLDEGEKFLHTYWLTMKEIIKAYSSMTKHGLIYHESGTWMDTLNRSNAVEIQGLWYNALRIMETLSHLMADDGVGRLDYAGMLEDFESNFTSVYWNGKCLDDCIGDSTLRPNQIIVAGLDYNPLDIVKSKTVLKVVEDELLTPYGLRSLARGDPRYRGKYVGGVGERELSYHNGTVWPWLLGCFIKAHVRYNPDSLRSASRFLNFLLDRHLREAGLGSISEIFDGDPPHEPRGCISQAWSVAEILRAYHEDILQKRPPYEKHVDGL